ncbi:hypothetical protein KKH30_01225 [Candidatus Micrarchaeota archaeon]|nr:hypothetical protein [Candidatus Micrarchaeota archaeon]
MILAILLLPSFCIALATPSITSSTHPEQDKWYHTGKMKFEWNAVGDGAAKYYFLLDHEPDTVPDESSENITELEYESSDKMEGTWHFHLRAKEGGEWGNAAHFKTQIDTTKPGIITNLAIEATAKGELTLTWDPAIDELSGVAGYKIFRSRLIIVDVRDSTVALIEPLHTGTTYVDTELEEGKTYHYILAAVDNTGTQGNVCKERFLSTTKYCSANVNLSYNWDREANTLNLDLSSEGALNFASLSLLLPDGNETALASGETGITSLSRSYDLSLTKQGNIVISLESKDSQFDPCNESITFPYDTVPPEITLTAPAEGGYFSGMLALSAQASDGGGFSSGIESVTFYYGTEGSWTEITKLSQQNGGKYSYDWNTANSPNGRYSLKATVADKAGNSAETPHISITLKNMHLVRTSASEAISSAEAAQSSAAEKEKAFNKEMVLTPYFSELISWADANLSAAQTSFEKGLDYERAQELAEIASSTYVKAEALFTTRNTGSKAYIFTESQILPLLQGTGLRADLAQQSAELVKNSLVTRKLEIIEVSSQAQDAQPYFQARVRISVTNNESSAVRLHVIEVVPKEFAMRAALLSSGEEFSVLREDPIIKFSGQDINPGETITINYSLTEQLTKEEADAMMQADTINKFTAPPIVLDDSAQVDGASFTMQFPLPQIPVIDLSAIFGGGQMDQGMVILGVGAVVIVLLLLIAAVLAGVIIFFLMRKRRR